MAKRNKRRMDARLKPYIWNWIEKVSDKTQATYTEVVEQALEKGLRWIEKKIRKELDQAFNLDDQAPVQINPTKETAEILEDMERERLKRIATTKWVPETKDE